jgi:hypothetical protein
LNQGERIAEAVGRLDQKNSLAIDYAWASLRPLGFAVVPYLRAAYGGFRHGEGRTALVYYATRYARIGDDAYELGLAALNDRSRQVRYRACGLLAYALRKEALPALQSRVTDPDPLVRDAAHAAIRAIQAGNHHLFVDRSESGRSYWSVNPGDDCEGLQPSPLMRMKSWLNNL